MPSSTHLKPHLDRLYLEFDQKYMFSDPIRLVRQFSEPRDQEIAALIMSSLAFGQVQQINKAGERIFELMDHAPRRFVDSFSPESALKTWRPFYYRMIRHSDVLRLLYALQQLLKRHDELSAWIHSNYKVSDEHLGIAWSRCVKEIKSIDKVRWVWRRSRGVGFGHLLPDPENRSACKRSYLLLRWMVRKDAVDLGLWGRLPKDKLIIPVDTHIARIAYNIGLTDRSDLSSKNAFEITSRLKQLDPDDPVKYDFAMCRL